MDSKQMSKDDHNNSMKMDMKNSKLVCCKIYISESRNAAALDAIERAARAADTEAAVVNIFQDREYNRVRYTLVSYIVVPHDGAGNCYSPMRQTLFAMVEAAYGAIDLRTHLGAHPRLGVVDHICFHPLARASLEDAAGIAKLVAADIGNALQVPVFLYEAAHPSNKALDAIRREMGYYRPNYNGIQWAGWTGPLSEQEHLFLPDRPDHGPTRVNPARGITIIGASRWVENYNVPILSTDVATTRRIARAVSERGGGLPTVQTLALVHGEDTTEIACILLDPGRVGADRVQTRVEGLAAEEGLDVEKGYYTEVSQEMIVERYVKLVSRE